MITKSGSRVIVISFIMALMLDSMPLPVGWLLWLKPNVTLLVLLYWVMMFAYRINIGTAFILGLLLDLANNSLLGEHISALVMVSYFMAKYHRQLQVGSLLWHFITISLLLLCYSAIVFVIEGVMGRWPASPLYWLSVASSIFCWPLVVILLNYICGRFKVR